MHGRRRSVKTTVDQPLMRGLITALQNIRPRLSLSLVRASILWDRPRGGIGNTPTVAPPPALHGRDGLLLSSACSVAAPLLFPSRRSSDLESKKRQPFVHQRCWLEV